MSMISWTSLFRNRKQIFFVLKDLLHFIWAAATKPFFFKANGTKHEYNCQDYYNCQRFGCQCWWVLFRFQFYLQSFSLGVRSTSVCLRKLPSEGMLSAWLNDMSYDMAISFYRRLNICLNQTLSSRLTFYGCKFWKIATKVARLLGVRTQENASYVSKHWFFNGKRTV